MLVFSILALAECNYLAFIFSIARLGEKSQIGPLLKCSCEKNLQLFWATKKPIGLFILCAT